MNMLVKMINPKDIEFLRNEFQKIDTDNSGFIEFKELERALLGSNIFGKGPSITPDEIDMIIKELDYDGNDMINYSEFLAATISVKQILTHEKIEALFLQFDVD